MRVDQRVELLGHGLHQRPMRTSAGVVDEDVKVLAAPLCLQRFDLATTATASVCWDL